MVKNRPYLGRKDDPDSITQANLLKVTCALDKSMGMGLKKYVESMVTYVKCMHKKDGIVYLRKRKTKLEKILNKVHENFDIK